MELNLATCVWLKKTWQVFLILSLLSYSKCKSLLHTLNVHEIPAKEHQGVDFLSRIWNISFGIMVLEIFRKCPSNITYLQETKEDKNIHIYNFFLLIAKYALVTIEE